MKPVRSAGAGCAEAAGTMASRNGSAMLAPAPLRTCRRDRCLRVMNMVMLLLAFPRAASVGGGYRPAAFFRGARCLYVTELVAADDPHDYIVKAVTLRRRLTHHLAYRGHVLGFNRSSQCIHHQA